MSADALLATLTGLANATTSALDTVVANDFTSRAAAIAKIIKREKPHVIGLQEVSTHNHVDIDEDENEIDFLDILRSALETEGLSYKLAIEAKGADIGIPILKDDGTPVTDPDTGNPVFARYRNSDVILVESSLTVTEGESREYGENLDLSLRGSIIDFGRSFAGVTLQRDGFSPFVVVLTQLEANPTVQTAQVTELMTYLADITDTPVFLIGDLNSFAPNTGGETSGATGVSYGLFITAGYTDSYLEANPAEETTANSTCCYGPTLDVAETTIGDYGRVDHILYRGDGITSSEVKFTGNEVGDQAEIPALSDGAIPARNAWPSNHLGVVGTFPGDL